MGKPANNYPSPDVFVNEALKLIEDAEKVGISLRVMGAIAVYLHSKDFKESEGAIYQPWVSEEFLATLARQKVRFAETVVNLIEKNYPEAKVLRSR